MTHIWQEFRDWIVLTHGKVKPLVGFECKIGACSRFTLDCSFSWLLQLAEFYGKYRRYNFPPPPLFYYLQIWYLQIYGCFSDWAPSFLHFWSSWLGQPLTRCRGSWINLILLLASLRFSKPFIFSRFQCSSWEALPSPADFSPCSSSLRPWVLGCLRLVHLSSLSHERKKSSWKWYF